MKAVGDSKEEYMRKGVTLSELFQHSEMIYKNATPEIKRKLVQMVIEPARLSNGTLEYNLEEAV